MRSIFSLHFILLFMYLSEFNSLAPSTFWLNFRWVIFKQILMIDGWVISCEITLRWKSQGLTDDKSTLVQVMAWCRQAIGHYLNQCWPRSMSPYGVTRPQCLPFIAWTRSACLIAGRMILQWRHHGVWNKLQLKCLCNILTIATKITQKLRIPGHMWGETTDDSKESVSISWNTIITYDLIAWTNTAESGKQNVHVLLQWRHNERDGVSNHRCLDRLFAQSFV